MLFHVVLWFVFSIMLLGEVALVEEAALSLVLCSDSRVAERSAAWRRCLTSLFFAVALCIEDLENSIPSMD
ncbi:hypothetical protein B0T18DRAFT_422982 [Schizothecium vesticola]|uniref:Secreted protein n=1 Tax=Schizothecium vesticola TaxID=314040 RepID=A0AA40BR35_9PEZI|nr:hypothetical protein B0T18DRAFT_422982 [Schizothecium vesticola]